MSEIFHDQRLVADCDLVTFHRYTPGQPRGGSFHFDPDMGEEIGRASIAGHSHASHISQQDNVWVRGIAWVGEVPVYLFEALWVGAGSEYRVGPFPLIITVSDV
jgi:hypothetical protein